MKRIIKREDYDIIYGNNGDVAILFDNDPSFVFSGEVSLMMRLDAEKLVYARLIDEDAEIELEGLPLPAEAVIEDKDDVIITELKEDGDVALNYLAKVVIG